MAASLLAMLAPRLARAVAYDYTAKVQGTGTTPKVNTTETAVYRWRFIPDVGAVYEWSSSLTSQSCSRWGSWNGNINCDAGGGCGAAGCPMCMCQPYSNTYGLGGGWYWPSTMAGAGGDAKNGPAPTRTIQACPTGSVESGGVCYVLVCPTATPPWEVDPGDTSRCRRPIQCPKPQVAGESGCTCPTGTQVYVPDGGGLAETAYWSATVPSTTKPSSMPATLCGRTGSNTAGCAVRVDAAGWNGTQIEYSGTVLTGATCTASQTDNTPGDDPACPAGQIRGTINGTSVCVTAGSTITDKPPTTTTTTKTNPDGTTETTTTTTTEKTTCDGDVCTTTITTNTTTVTKDAQGNTTGTTTETGTETTAGKGGNGSGDGDGEGTESSFGGACPSFSCDGDAVQCAMALEQHKRNCELLTDKGTFSREDAEGEFDTSRNFDKAQLTTEGSLASITSSTFLGGGCLADATYDVHGYSFVIPFSSLCVYLQAAGLAFLAVCGLISFGIVSRGVTA